MVYNDHWHTGWYAMYEEHRVFFADEKTALAAGYRPCGNCLREQYTQYKANPEQYKAQFGIR